jgi:hypothetical protein
MCRNITEGGVFVSVDIVPAMLYVQTNVKAPSIMPVVAIDNCTFAENHGLKGDQLFFLLK